MARRPSPTRCRQLWFGPSDFRVDGARHADRGSLVPVETLSPPCCLALQFYPFRLGARLFASVVRARPPAGPLRAGALEFPVFSTGRTGFSSPLPISAFRTDFLLRSTPFVLATPPATWRARSRRATPRSESATRLGVAGAGPIPTLLPDSGLPLGMFPDRTDG